MIANKANSKFLSLKKRAKMSIALLLVIALFVPSTSAFAFSTAYPNTWKNTGNQAQDIVQIALSQVGYAEQGSNHTKYCNWYYGSDIGVAWCAIFISWCANQAGIPTSIIAKNALASGFSTSNMSKNSYGCPGYAFGSTPARPGDIIYVASSGGGTTNHVGLVVAVDKSYIYTVEGNSSDKVTKVKYAVSNGHRVWGSYTSNARIVFYARPKYNGSAATVVNKTTTTTEAASVTTTAKPTTTTTTEATTVSTTETTKTTVAANNTANTSTTANSATATQDNTVANNAQTGTSSAQTAGQSTGSTVVSDTPQTLSASLSGARSAGEIGPYTLGKYKMDTAVYMRDGANLSSDIVATLKEGAEVEVSKIDGRFGYVTVDDKSGWVSLKYSTQINCAEGYTCGNYKLDTSMVLRSGAGTSYDAVGILPEGTEVEATIINGRFGYVTVGNKSGWVSLKYATQTKVTSGYLCGTYKLDTTMTMREGADTSYSEMGYVSEGSVVEASQVSGRFGYVTVGGKTGWVSLKYATKQ